MILNYLKFTAKKRILNNEFIKDTQRFSGRPRIEMFYFLAFRLKNYKFSNQLDKVGNAFPYMFKL